MKGLSVRLQQARPIPLAAQLECPAGGLHVLVGPSGSGKSTVLRCIAGLHYADGGRIQCQGSVWWNPEQQIKHSPQRRRVGFVFQHYSLFPHLTAVENVSMAMGHITRARRRARADGLLGLVNLQGLGNRKPEQLSGGQQQRVALARALARDPQVLLLDEPFAAVDQVTRRKLQRELARLRHQLKMPIILVTHDIEEAILLGDLMTVLHHGDTLQTGPPLELVSRPDNALVARLVGLTNVFQGQVVGHTTDGNVTHVTWLDMTLLCGHQHGFEVGDDVDWVVPPQSVILHQRVRPSRGERENPVAGIIKDFVVLGDSTTITMLVNELEQVPLTFAIPLHVARRNSLAEGEKISVSLVTDGIHLMAKHRPSLV